MFCGNVEDNLQVETRGNQFKRKAGKTKTESGSFLELVENVEHGFHESNNQEKQP